jgi:hypothetical protein
MSSKHAIADGCTDPDYLDGNSSMSGAITSIVEGYITLKDHTSLQELREYRQRLRRQLQSQSKGSAFDPRKTIQLFDSDLQIIEAAISRLSLA